MITGAWCLSGGGPARADGSTIRGGGSHHSAQTLLTEYLVDMSDCSRQVTSTTSDPDATPTETAAGRGRIALDATQTLIFALVASGFGFVFEESVVRSHDAWTLAPAGGRMVGRVRRCPGAVAG
jgi:hypothetical protein